MAIGLKSLHLEVCPGKIVGLRGPSGSGKSTLSVHANRACEKLPRAHVLWHGKQMRRGRFPTFAIVFQSFALFSWLTVLENVEAPLVAKGIGGKRD